MTGKTLDDRQIAEKVGEGDGSVLYKARDSHLDRFVAVRVPPADRGANPEPNRRFMQEAKTASALNHPSIITIYNIDQSEGTNCTATEHLAFDAAARPIGGEALAL